MKNGEEISQRDGYYPHSGGMTDLKWNVKQEEKTPLAQGFGRVKTE